MNFTSNDKFTFGKYEGIQVGMVYMLAPGYIEWMLTTTAHYIEDLELLTSLKVMDRFGNKSITAHHTEVDLMEFEQLWKSKVTFEEIMYSGFRYYNLSKTAVYMNSEKRDEERFYDKEELENVEILPPENPEILIYFPNHGVNSLRTIFTPIATGVSKKGFNIVNFEANNKRWYMQTLPHQETVKVASFFLTDWGISHEEIDRRISERLPFFGRIKDGFLDLEKQDVNLKAWYVEQGW